MAFLVRSSSHPGAERAESRKSWFMPGWGVCVSECSTKVMDLRRTIRHNHTWWKFEMLIGFVKLDDFLKRAHGGGLELGEVFVH